MGRRSTCAIRSSTTTTSCSASNAWARSSSTLRMTCPPARSACSPRTAWRRRCATTASGAVSASSTPCARSCRRCTPRRGVTWTAAISWPSSGTQTSSNAQRLVEVARNAGATAALIGGEGELDIALLDDHQTIGLTAGASTPEELVESALSRLAELGWDQLEEVTVAREDVHFRLPREVAAAQ